MAGDINGLGSVDSVASHYRAHQYRYQALTHVAALNRLAQLDPARAAVEAARPHAIVLEKFLPPHARRLAPRSLLAAAARAREFSARL